jgi:hypothetical protein
MDYIHNTIKRLVELKENHGDVNFPISTVIEMHKSMLNAQSANKVTFSEELTASLIVDITDELSSNLNENAVDDVEFSLEHGNTIELSSLSLKSREIERHVRDAVEKWISNLEEEETEEAEEEA